MTISSLVLTLSDDSSLQRDALRALSQDRRCTLGELHGVRLPLVLETDSAGEGRDAAEALLDLTGVTFVDVVAVHFEDVEQED